MMNEYSPVPPLSLVERSRPRDSGMNVENQTPILFNTLEKLFDSFYRLPLPLEIKITTLDWRTVMDVDLMYGTNSEIDLEFPSFPSSLLQLKAKVRCLISIETNLEQELWDQKELWSDSREGKIKL